MVRSWFINGCNVRSSSYQYIPIAGIERVRFGYVDRNDGFAFVYEGSENDLTIFPGERLCIAMHNKTIQTTSE